MAAITTDALSASMENYLETIFILVRDYTVARSKDIADRLKVKRSSVTGALQTLKERGLVNYEPYGYVTLTETGTAVASKVLRRHEALRDFFVNVLSIDPAEADAAACRMDWSMVCQLAPCWKSRRVQDVNPAKMFLILRWPHLNWGWKRRFIRGLQAGPCCYGKRIATKRSSSMRGSSHWGERTTFLGHWMLVKCIFHSVSSTRIL